MLWYIKMKEDNHGLNCKAKTKTIKKIKKIIERTMTKTG
jgi:hypothetical protein